MRSFAPGSRTGPRTPGAVVSCVLSASPFPVRACRKLLQLAMQKQDTILGDGQAGHVDGLGGGSQTAASLPVTEGQERTKGILGWRWLPKPQIDLEGFDAPNFAHQVGGPAWPTHAPGGPSLECVEFGIASRRPSASQRRARARARARARQCDRCGLYGVE